MRRRVIPTATPSLRQNTVGNLVGNAAPLLVAFFALPALTRTLGPARFGVLTLAWVVLGYFSLFDLGLGRAMTKDVAERIGLGQEETVPALVWTTLALMAALGLAGTIVTSMISPWLVHHALRIPSELETETLHSFYALAVSIPIVTTMAGLRGVLEAKQRFDLVNAIRIPFGAFTFLGPVIVLPFSQSLLAIVIVLLIGRVVAWACHLLLCLRLLPALRRHIQFDRSLLGPLLRFGSWISVSNVVGPLMVSVDRFVIGALLSVSAVAYYTAPYEMVTKLWMIPAAFAGALFPAFAAVWSHDVQRAASLLRQGIKYTFLLLFPLTLVIATLGQEGLTLWLGHDYGVNSTRVLQWLAIGVFLNSLAQIPFALIQAAGRPDLTAKLHVFELPFYLGALWWLIRAYGIQGAAIAWTLRAFIDTTAVFGIARHLASRNTFPVKWIGLCTAAAILILAVVLFPLGLRTRASLLAISLVVFGIITWAVVLAEQGSRWRAQRPRLERGP